MTVLRNMYASALLLRRLERIHGTLRISLPVVIAPNPLVENYKSYLKALERTFLNRKLARCISPVKKIQVAICHEFNISDQDMMGKSTKHKYAIPRQVAMYLAKTHVKKPERAIAALFGKDHTCVRYAYRKIPKLIAANSQLAQQVSAVESLLKLVA